MARVPPRRVGLPGLSLAELHYSLGRMWLLGRARHRNGLKGTVPAVPTCQEPQDPQGRGSGWWQDLLHARCSPGSCHRGYCRDFTMALRAWGVSGTEGDEL